MSLILGNINGSGSAERNWRVDSSFQHRLNRLTVMLSKPAFSPSEVANWMLAELERDGTLYQETAVSEIERRFSAKFTSINENGNLSIRKDVLASFRKISGEGVVWERGERLWRKRESYDQPGRQQD